MEEKIPVTDQPASTPPETPPIPPTPAPRFSFLKNRKFLMIGAVVLVFLILTGAGGYLYLQNQQLKSQMTATPPPAGGPEPSATPDPIAGWKTYRNTKYNYELKYPNDFKIVEESADKVYISNSLPPDPNCKGGGCNRGTPRLNIFFEHLNNPGEDAMSLEEYANARRESLLDINNEQGKIEKMQMFGLDVRFMEGVAEGYVYNYFLKPNSNLSFSISVVFPSKKEVTKYQELADQILSTFKFTDEVSQPPYFSTPKANSKITNPLYVSGIVPAGWMFEGNVPVKLLDENHKLIAQAPGEEVNPGTWMDDKPDEFKSTLTFTTSAKSGYLVVGPDNPSGLPENEKSYEIPVKF